MPHGASVAGPSFHIKNGTRSEPNGMVYAMMTMGRPPWDTLTDKSISCEGAESKEEAIKAALECPCVEGLKTSSCGEGFVEALSCFMRAEESERGAACVEPFVALHACMVKHPEEFEEFTKELVENETKEGYIKAEG